MPATIIIHTHSIYQEILCVGRAGGIEPAIGGQPTLPPAPQPQLQVTKIKNAIRSWSWTYKCGVNRGVNERWENLRELGRLSQVYPCTLTHLPQGSESGSRWGLVNSIRVWTLSCGLSAEGFCVCVCVSACIIFSPPSFEFMEHFTPWWGSKCTLASTGCTLWSRPHGI